MPLLRVAHPSEEDCRKELDRLKSNLTTEDLTRDISTKGSRQKPSVNPLLFDFEHNYDPQLTPRRKWEQKVIVLKTKLDESESELTKYKTTHYKERNDLEKQMIILDQKVE